MTETTQPETFGEMCARRMREYEKKQKNPEPPKPHTTCMNYECPSKADGSCNHNVWTDGMKCKGNESGYHYKSQMQAIWHDYVKECERKGENPMPRDIYFEG